GGKGDGARGRSGSALLRLLGRGPFGFLFLLLDRRDRIASREPAVEIDVGAALRAERPKSRARRLAADRAFPGAGHQFGHASNIGPDLRRTVPLRFTLRRVRGTLSRKGRGEARSRRGRKSP